MDVNTISSLSQQTAALSAGYKKTTISVTTEAENGKTMAGTMTEAYSLDVAAAAKSAAGAAKALTPEQADALKQGIQKSQQLMIQTLTEQNLKLRGGSIRALAS